jgi:hypothetical protein
MACNKNGHWIDPMSVFNFLTTHKPFGCQTAGKHIVRPFLAQQSKKQTLSRLHDLGMKNPPLLTDKGFLMRVVSFW